MEVVIEIEDLFDNMQLQMKAGQVGAQKKKRGEWAMIRSSRSLDLNYCRPKGI